MSNSKSVVAFVWKIGVAGVVMTFGVMAGAMLASAWGLELPKVPGRVDPTSSTLLLLAGSMAFAAGLAALDAGLAGGRSVRFVVLAAFGVIVHAIGNALEASIFSTLGGELASLAVRLPSTVLGALAVVLLFGRTAGEGAREKTSVWLDGWSAGRLSIRLVLAVAAFPLIYFSFGIMIAPIVTPHYQALDFLVIPPLSTILTVLSIRSVLLLLASLPVIVLWIRSRGQLVLALGLGHFVAVGLTDLIQASFFPAILRWTHGAEILADSFVYALALVWLLVPRTAHEYEKTTTMLEQPV
ncbi:MAG: hypothetical protein R3338_01700 [Thermoanaerobaculia bacterium]|nr:hypothetical protein [Thermoanaerobaculia bacterium]